MLRALSTEPEEIDLARPSAWMVPTSVRSVDGVESPIPSFQSHLLCRDDGSFPTELNNWELSVLQREMARDGFLAWYRNPSRSQQESLSIVYEDSGAPKLMRPDFLFFAKASGGGVACDIVDPHGIHLGDALPKLKGLANYASAYGGHFRRIESVAKVGDGLRVLDLTDDEVRSAVLAATDAKELFSASVASPY